MRPFKSWIGILCCLLWASSCAPKTTPPGPNSIGGVTVGGKSFTILRWEEGLTVMFWYDVDNYRSGGHGSTEDPVHRHRGSATTADGRSVNWELETTDGKTAVFRLNKTEYDLLKGRLFLITTKGVNVEVQQLDRDLSSVHDSESALTFGKSDTDVSRFLQQ